MIGSPEHFGVPWAFQTTILTKMDSVSFFESKMDAGFGFTVRPVPVAANSLASIDTCAAENTLHKSQGSE
jgi:hypothetical protein